MDRNNITMLLSGDERRPNLFNSLPGLTLIQRLELFEQLAIQEDLSQMLSEYARWLVNMLPISQLSYQYHEQHLQLLDAGMSDHHLTLQLETPDHLHLGQFCYHFKGPITPHQKRIVLQMQQFILVPLRLFLRLEQYRQQAYRDHLTGAGNRAQFDQSLNQAIAHNRRAPSGLSLLVLDLDRFKILNDTFGHPTGDQVLIEFTALLQEVVRASDQVFRLGGDEFAVILSPCQHGFSTQLQERLHQHMKLHSGLAHYQLTCSIGCSHWHDNMNAQILYQMADQDLYRNKNRCFHQVNGA